MPTVQFSLNARQVEILESFVKQGESLNLAAKRVLTEFLLNIPNQGKAELSRALELDRAGDQRMIDDDDSDDDSDDKDLTSTDWNLQCLDARIKILEIAIGADHHYPNYDELTNQSQAIAKLEERIEKLQIEIETLTTLSKQPATPNNGESIIFLADSEGNPIQFWTGQVWTDDLNLAYRYKGVQAMARTMDKLKKRKFSGEGLPGGAIASTPIEKLIENGES